MSTITDSEKKLADVLAAFEPNIVENRLIPAEAAKYTDFPAGLDERLKGALRERGIEKVYTHQSAVFDETAAGRSVVVVSPTASGKTLCYNLPVLQALLADNKARALYLFPAKALSQDQQAALNELLLRDGREYLPLRAVTYDGDTPASLRTAARERGRIVISNPDMLHQGILPNHPKWIKFFANLKYVVIDEAHAYRGVFGSHTANVIRRLKRIAAFYGSTPRFILCSATISNPVELAGALTGEDVKLIDNNGAPRGEKRVVLYNPPIVDAVQGIRRSSVQESRRWMLAFLRAGVKTILFAHSRIKTEIAATYVNSDLANINTGNSNIRVEPYRGGLLPNERREIERGLRSGEIQGVVSTNALELGIDIGGLDASIVSGFPGSFNAFWQQSGRAGRRGGLSVSVFVASSAPLDQFIMRNPDWFFRKSTEECRINSDNPYIYFDHVKCSAFELPFADETEDARSCGAQSGDAKSSGGNPFGESAFEVLSELEEEGIVRHTGGFAPGEAAKWYWASRSYPAEGVSLRSATADNVVIVDTTSGRNSVIGEMDRPSAKEMLFDNAVYLHRGTQYIVTKLDVQNRKAFVTESTVNYFTDGLVKTDIKILAEDQATVYGDATAVLGDALVRTQVTKFKKLRFHTHENIGFGDISQGEEEMQTRALALLFGGESGGLLAAAGEEAAASALAGSGRLIRQVSGVFLLCDARDLGVTARIRDPHFDKAALYIYDKYPGGIGLSEALFTRCHKIFAAAYQSLAACPCKSGCPSCVGPGEDKETAFRFLKTLNQNRGR
ncbi:MAG: DEAD/DEAH box helicase [Spirochaetaceae bacterium]|jgi:DEAD/DEAH box helicase domain-containing protein|nr:DEAD/DEAH box helicase [Spirochaetaceae bacterium]